MNQLEILRAVRLAKGHDPDAFTRLMQHYRKDMYRTAIAILMNDEDAADAMQETILTCWEKFPMLKESRYFKTWMTRILINHCYAIRKQRKEQVPIEDYTEVIAAEDNSNLEFNDLLSLLEEKYRLPLMLYYGEGYKAKEIARLLELPLSTVQTRLSRGRRKLADTLTYGKELSYEKTT